MIAHQLRLTFFKVICIAVSISSIIPTGSAQQANYGFIGHLVNKRSAETGEILATGELLKDSLLGLSEVEKLTFRYATDVQAYRQNGTSKIVERLLDFYYPSRDIVFEYGNGLEVNRLPVLFVLHAGSGDKDTSADYAMYWASLGFTVVVPTVRSDRLGVNYCEGFRKTIYYTVQDLRAAVRMFSKLYDYSQLDDEVLMSFVTSKDQADVVDQLRHSRADGESIFMIGKSYGGTTAYHTCTRVQQEEYPSYLWADEPYIIDGIDGPVDLGQSGLLDDVGVPFILSYPFPANRRRGIICRTAGVFDSAETIDYGGMANPVPGLFIHNTCDALVPYTERTFLHDDGLCFADITRPDGSIDSTAHLVGSVPITEHMHEAGIYSELITYCGGGHDSNACVQDLNDGHSATFVRRILSGNYTPGDLHERVYRYHLQNYSDQCCEIGDEYGFMLKCSCDPSNPYSVINIPYKSPEECSVSATCDLISMCDLEPPGIMGSDKNSTQNDHLSIILSSDEDGTHFEIESAQSGLYRLQLRRFNGQLLHESTVLLGPGINRFSLPSGLPHGEPLIGQVGNSAPVKFHLSR